jgi:hypothetical protein
MAAIKYSQSSKRLYCARDFFRYIIRVNRLTKQEQMFLIIVLGLLLTGWAVKTYRTAHFTATKPGEGAPPVIVQEAKP